MNLTCRVRFGFCLCLGLIERPLVAAPLDTASPSDYPQVASPEQVTPQLREEQVIVVYEEQLGREPSAREIRDCRSGGRERIVTEEDLRRRLRGSREARAMTPEDVIRKAYADILGREPDAQGFRTYRSAIIEKGWTPGQVRQSLRESSEYSQRSTDIIIERAFEDVLERKPDAVGRDHYRKLLAKGMTERQIREAMRQSEEYRVALPDSKTRRAYLAMLHREPDPRGLVNYRKKIVDEGWTEEDVKNDLKNNPEYRKR